MGPHWRRTPSMGRGWTCTKCGICRSRQRTRCVCVCVCACVCVCVCMGALARFFCTRPFAFMLATAQSLSLFPSLSLFCCGLGAYNHSPTRAHQPHCTAYTRTQGAGLATCVKQKAPLCGSEMCAHTPQAHARTQTHTKSSGRGLAPTHPTEQVRISTQPPIYILENRHWTSDLCSATISLCGWRYAAGPGSGPWGVQPGRGGCTIGWRTRSGSRGVTISGRAQYSMVCFSPSRSIYLCLSLSGGSRCLSLCVWSGANVPLCGSAS